MIQFVSFVASWGSAAQGTKPSLWELPATSQNMKRFAFGKKSRERSSVSTLISAHSTDHRYGETIEYIEVPSTFTEDAQLKQPLNTRF